MTNDTDPRLIHYAKLLRLEILGNSDKTVQNYSEGSELTIDDFTYSRYSHSSLDTNVTSTRIDLKSLKAQILSKYHQKNIPKNILSLIVGYLTLILRGKRVNDCFDDFQQILIYLKDTKDDLQNLVHLISSFDKPDLDKQLTIFMKLVTSCSIYLKSVNSSNQKLLDIFSDIRKLNSFPEVVEYILESAQIKAVKKSSFKTNHFQLRPQYQMLIDPSNRFAEQSINRSKMMNSDNLVTLADRFGITYKDNLNLITYHISKNDPKNVSKFIKYQSLLNFSSPKETLNSLMHNKMTNEVPELVVDVSILDGIKFSSIGEIQKILSPKDISPLTIWNETGKQDLSNLISFIEVAGILNHSTTNKKESPREIDIKMVY
jgi:hypothetical protein